MTSAIEDGGSLALSGAHRRTSRKYLRALEYAHRHAEAQTPKLNCLHYLAKYLDEQIIEVDLYVEEAPDEVAEEVPKP
jgi:hypothetical protein